MRPRPDVHPPPFDQGRLAGLIARAKAGELTRRERFELDALIEDRLAREGTAVVALATAHIIDRLIAGEAVSLQEIEAVRYSIWASALSEYFEPDEPEFVLA